VAWLVARNAGDQWKQSEIQPDGHSHRRRSAARPEGFEPPTF
jgi:hypothetical protein